MNGQSTPEDAAAYLTTPTLVLIAIAIAVVLIVIWWGSKLARRRHAAEREIIADGARREDPAPVTEATVRAMPVAPSPPPLADTEVVAAAPFEAAPAAMAVDLASPPPASAPAAGKDDFTRMKGVGPKLAARLTELGITSYAQIAAFSPEDADALDAQLGTFKGRIGRDRWIEQAGYLAKDDRAGFEAAFGKL